MRTFNKLKFTLSSSYRAICLDQCWNTETSTTYRDTEQGLHDLKALDWRLELCHLVSSYCDLGCPADRPSCVCCYYVWSMIPACPQVDQCKSGVVPWIGDVTSRFSDHFGSSPWSSSFDFIFMLWNVLSRRCKLTLLCFLRPSSWQSPPTSCFAVQCLTLNP